MPYWLFSITRNLKAWQNTMTSRMYILHDNNNKKLSFLRQTQYLININSISGELQGFDIIREPVISLDAVLIEVTL